MFYGSMVPLVTPFTAEKDVDHRALKALVNWHRQAGTNSLLVCGSTGEALALSAAEQYEVLKTCIETADGDLPIVAGVIAATTPYAIELAQAAEQAGADAVMPVAPFYCKPSQEQMFQFYKTIHQALNIPVFLYNNPSRCGVSIAVDTVAGLSELPRIIGLKDATSDITRCTLIKNRVAKEFTMLSGDTLYMAGFLAHGGDGVISASANVAPELTAQFVRAWHDQHIDLFNHLIYRLMQLDRVMFTEPSPAPIKYGLSLLDKINPDVRLPLTTISDTCKNDVKNVLLNLGIL